MIKKLIFFLFVLLLFGCKTSNISIVTNLSSISSTNKTYQTNSTTNTSNITTNITTVPNDSNETNLNWFRLSGFAQGYITDRTHKKSEDSDYASVENELQFIQALSNTNIKVIEIKNNLNLGYYELQKQFDVTKYSIVKPHNSPLLHPVLLETGISKIYIQDRNQINNKKSLLIFSKEGITIKHASFIIKRSEDIVFRNLKFDELWEFDENTKGNYDRNDWDYITIEESNGIWLDHLEFNKSYDGLVDVKKGSKNVTISWSKFKFEPNDFLYSQFNYLENNKESYPMYQFMRQNGMTIDDIVLLNSSQKKGHLIGSSELDPSNESLSVTLHHNWYINLQDRLPRLRGGNVHLYNVILNNSEIDRVKSDFTNKFPKVMGTTNYKIGLINQGIVSTENGAVLMENSIFKGVASPIKNNQKNTELLYTGKYKVVNSQYILNNYEFIGESDDEGTPFIAKPVAAIYFSWNQIEVLPYLYQLVDIHSLEEFMNSGYVGTLNSNINWLEIKEVER